MSSNTKEKRMFMERKEKITEDTQFDFYTSEKAISEGRGKNKVNGIIYVERIRSGHKPYLRKRYDDLKVILTAKQSEYKIEKLLK